MDFKNNDIADGCFAHHSQNENANDASSGLNSYAQICEQDLGILRQLNFIDQHVLELSYGQSSAIKFAVKNGARSYISVDVSFTNVDNSKNSLQKNDATIIQKYSMDAIKFCKEFLSENNNKKINIVLLLNFIEYNSRSDLMVFFALLASMVSDTAIIAVNTPIYALDKLPTEDAILQDIGVAFPVLSESDSDSMVVAAFTTQSLKHFFAEYGFQALTEAHFFTPSSAVNNSLQPSIPFRKRWEDAHEQGVPIVRAYQADVIQYANERSELPSWERFDCGTLNGLNLLLTSGNRNITFANGKYDDSLLQHMQKTIVTGKEVIFDVGGFIGVDSLCFARYLGEEGRVICFEPNPWNVDRICNHLSYNSHESDKIVVYPFALGDRNRQIVMFLSDNVDIGYSSTSQCLDGDGTINSYSYLRRIGFAEVYVPMMTLDSFVKEAGVAPDIIKVDIEGAEAHFLLGSLETLCTIHPKLYLELHSQLATFRCMQILQILGYETRILHEEMSQGMLHIYAERSFIDKKKIESVSEVRLRIDPLIDDICRMQADNIKKKDSKDDTFSGSEDIKEEARIMVSSCDAQYKLLQGKLAMTQRHLAACQAQLAVAMNSLDDPIIRFFNHIRQKLS